MVPICSHLAPRRLTRLLQCCGWVLLFAFPTLSRAADSTAEINRWFSVQTNLQSWQAEFTETRTLKVLNQPLVSPGHVWVKPGEFRWELGQPVSTIVLRHPDQLLIIYPQLKHAEKYALDQVPPGPIKDALSLLDASLPRDRATMEKQFHLVSAFETNSVLQMNLQPNSASARKFIGDVTIGFHTNDFSIAFTEMKVADGSVLRNDFTNVLMNQPIDDSKFDAAVPPDYSVIEPLRH
jgi:outer membrane lipoprotein-sorting protein